MPKIVAKIACNNICVFCKQKLKKGDEISLLPNGVVIHMKPCLQKIKKLAEKTDRITQ